MQQAQQLILLRNLGDIALVAQSAIIVNRDEVVRRGLGFKLLFDLEVAGGQRIKDVWQFLLPGLADRSANRPIEPPIYLPVSFPS